MTNIKWKPAFLIVSGHSRRKPGDPNKKVLEFRLQPVDASGIEDRLKLELQIQFLLDLQCKFIAWTSSATTTATTAASKSSTTATAAKSSTTPAKTSRAAKRPSAHTRAARVSSTELRTIRSST